MTFTGKLRSLDRLKCRETKFLTKNGYETSGQLTTVLRVPKSCLFKPFFGWIFVCNPLIFHNGFSPILEKIPIQNIALTGTLTPLVLVRIQVPQPTIHIFRMIARRSACSRARVCERRSGSALASAPGFLLFADLDAGFLVIFHCARVIGHIAGRRHRFRIGETERAEV